MVHLRELSKGSGVNGGACGGRGLRLSKSRPVNHARFRLVRGIRAFQVLRRKPRSKLLGTRATHHVLNGRGFCSLRLLGGQIEPASHRTTNRRAKKHGLQDFGAGRVNLTRCDVVFKNGLPAFLDTFQSRSRTVANRACLERIGKRLAPCLGKGFSDLAKLA